MNMPFKRALITGIQGSGGAYLAEYIAENHPDVQIHGTSRWHSTTTGKNLKAIEDRVKIHECDLVDFSSIMQMLENVKPDVVFHLAAQSNVRAAFITPLAVVQNNIMGTANFLEAVRIAGQNPVFQLCSTSEVYGQVDPKNVPITEDCPIMPSSPYAVSKAAQDMLGFTYFRSYGMKIIRTRMFAYLNPRRTDLFATSFARQVARIELGLQDELVHGNLDSVRTLIDVRDAMRAYWDAAVHCVPGEVYNIGGPTVMKVGDFLDALKRLAKVPIKTRVDQSLLRPSDVTLQIPKIDKFVAVTGWKARYTFEQSIEHLLDVWRKEAQWELFQKREGL